MGKYDDFFNDWDVPNMGGYTKEEFLNRMTQRKN